MKKFCSLIFSQVALTTTQTLLLLNLSRVSSFLFALSPRRTLSQGRTGSLNVRSNISLIRTAAVTASLCRSPTIASSQFSSGRGVMQFINSSDVSFVGAEKAIAIDKLLMEQPGFSIDQLMELAGYSVACAAHDYYANFLCRGSVSDASLPADILVLAGPGNNGGDGLVAARHLKHFGYSPSIYYPKPGKSELFLNLLKQCEDLGIEVEYAQSSDAVFTARDYKLIIDSVFGFSFQGPVRDPFTDVIASLAATTVPVLSVDVPSGWSVEDGDIYATGFIPGATISLTVPKLCMKNYEGKHYVGGRFVPPNVQSSLQLQLPNYGFGPSQIVEIARHNRDEKDDTDQVSVMFVTASSIEESRTVARALIRKKLAACVNIIPQIESVYEWEGQVEQSQEFLLMIKTRKSMQNRVTKAVREVHSYDLPESIAIDISGGSEEYIEWVKNSTAAGEEVDDEEKKSI